MESPTSPLVTNVLFMLKLSNGKSFSLAAVSNRIARVFNISGVAVAIEIDILKAFDRYWHVGQLSQAQVLSNSDQLYGLILSFSVTDSLG